MQSRRSPASKWHKQKHLRPARREMYRHEVNHYTENKSYSRAHIAHTRHAYLNSFQGKKNVWILFRLPWQAMMLAHATKPLYGSCTVCRTHSPLQADSMSEPTSIAIDFSMKCNGEKRRNEMKRNKRQPQRQIEIKYDKFVERWNDIHINCCCVCLWTNWTCSTGIKETQRPGKREKKRENSTHKTDRNENIWKEIFMYEMNPLRGRCRCNASRAACILHSEKWLSAF